MTTTLSIDFTNTNHLNYISKLSKRNNFYPEQLHVKMFRKYQTNHGYAMIKNEMDLFINEKYRKGYFLIENKKVIGFILYQKVENVYAKLDFLLIDKNYQNKGFGTVLYHILDNECITNKLQFLIVECDKNSRKYYENKFNFIDIDTEVKKRIEIFKITRQTDDYDSKLQLCVLH